ncbi:unnamed protein product [Clonostachys rosea]|uniref:Uncharacterized protein n=1 Tax=Bionectria ochroleuca TaxID=29856 RepID=A0ABY6TQF6_BIOOC|nr:unnamed protein product [Clonostachys rosea]
MPSLKDPLVITRCGEPVRQASNTPSHSVKLVDSMRNLGYRGSGADSATASETKSAKAVLGKDLAVEPRARDVLWHVPRLARLYIGLAKREPTGEKQKSAASKTDT